MFPPVLAYEEVVLEHFFIHRSKIQVGKGISILTRKVWQARPILLYLTIEVQCESTIYHNVSRWNMIAPADKCTMVLSRNVV